MNFIRNILKAFGVAQGFNLGPLLRLFEGALSCYVILDKGFDCLGSLFAA